MNRIKNVFAFVGMVVTIIVIIITALFLYANLNHGTTKKSLVTPVERFEARELRKINPFRKYELVDSLEFEIEPGYTQLYSGTNVDKGVVFSFYDLSVGMFNTSLVVENVNGEIIEDTAWGTPNYIKNKYNNAMMLKLKPQEKYELKFGNASLPSFNSDWDDEIVFRRPISGKLNVYIIK